MASGFGRPAVRVGSPPTGMDAGAIDIAPRDHGGPVFVSHFPDYQVFAGWVSGGRLRPWSRCSGRRTRSSCAESRGATNIPTAKTTKAETDRGAFKTPTLRNIARSAPYMHDGSAKTLKDVVDFYVGGGSSNPQLDKEIKELKLTDMEREDLIAFLESLNGSMPANSGPPESK